MKSSTTIREMLSGNEIYVPNYQRAYSWELETETSKANTQVNEFLSDIKQYLKSKTKTPYYFGHFLFEKKDNNRCGIIDGQQRLTTIVIFLSALFKQIKTLRELSDDEMLAYNDMIKKNSSYRFCTIEYDDQLFKDYVINQSKKDDNGVEMVSAQRFVNAFKFFQERFASEDVSELSVMLQAVANASCTTHQVTDESEAIQMFIFQNNRGKKPSNLEIIKAEFMFSVHLYGAEEKDELIKEIKNRFEKIYKSISSIEYRLDEDQVLINTLRVYLNSLSESNALDRIQKILSEENPLIFIKAFTEALSSSFENLTIFYGKDEQQSIEIHSLITLGGFGLVLPFIIKAYAYGVSVLEKRRLCSSLESLILRHRLIGTRADIIARIREVFEHFTEDNYSVQPIIDKINFIRNAPAEAWWWTHWNNEALGNAIKGKINHATAKFLLWKYENHLESKGKTGYLPTRFDKIILPELEHIAPQTENPAKGYAKYDDEFRQQYLHCLGNYLLVSKSHNCSIGNHPFKTKLASYNILAQHREIQQIAAESNIWNKKLISKRKINIINFIIQEL